MARSGLSSARQIAEACESPLQPGLFCIGSFGTFVNFSAQQYRSLNLVWALNKLNKIPRDRPVAVVGGGLSGISVAMALVHLGYKVELFERQKELLAHQLTTDHRLIHPTINNWPFESLVPNTDLPFLNWVSGPCSNVTFDILREVESAQSSAPDRFAIRRNRRITRILRGMNGFLLRSSRGQIDTPYGAVILTIGFGEERQHEDFEAPSYWYPDGLEREALIGDVENFIISGCGDGGLIDALRILHRDFNKGGLIFETANGLEGSELSRDIASCEQARLAPPELQMAYVAAAEKLASDPTYRPVHEPLQRSLGQCRPVVVMSARTGENPFVARSAPIHKLMLAHAMVMDKAVYVRAELVKDRDSLVLGSLRFPATKSSVIIVRHGPIGPHFSDLLDSVGVEHLRTRQLAIEGLFTRAVWSGTYPDARPEGITQKALRMHRQAVRAIRLVNPYALVTTSPHGFVVLLTDASDSDAIPPELFGVPVRVALIPDTSSGSGV